MLIHNLSGTGADMSCSTLMSLPAGCHITE